MGETSVEEVVAQLDERGYATVPGAIGPDQLAWARAELEALVAETPVGRVDFEGYRTRRVYGLFGKTRALDALATHEGVLGVLDRVLGVHYQLSAPTGISIGPGERAQAMHPDDAIYPLPRPHPEVVVNVMWPLQDFTAANGATRIVPGSHRWTDEVPGPDTSTVTVELPAGTALLYTGSVWHGGGANDSDADRLGVVLHYAVSWLRPVENHVLVVPPVAAAELPVRLQELLGYNVHPPFIGYVDGRHPRKLIDVARTSLTI
ncbi:MAG TPA: phytanoyl-CoA dioxygenase family protein [Acidimicrobiales bacterium]|nr:phytanoyl-CoA dioxygenase family protein [Acidimicrobiales bacterium]